MLDDSGALASVDAVGVNWGRRRDNAERQLRSNSLGIESKSSWIRPERRDLHGGGVRDTATNTNTGSITQGAG